MLGDYGNKKNPVAPFEFSEDEELLRNKAEEPLAKDRQAQPASALSKNRVYAPHPLNVKEECKTMFPSTPFGDLISPVIVRGLP